ncbi:unnamed protein product [Rotaria sordida]|uniref:Uncharacterized protein n=1 Tax=Rotaria sordida TaxID=392033 RepID=A0A819I6C4_9BILA|nr:unnamed protein product [Rotaria sordida]CAF3908508.1 unnamed protein product [Rotaria sordida]
MAQVNSMCYTYGRGKTLIQQSRKYFKQQLEEVTSKLNEHIKLAPSTIDTNKLMTIATDLVNKDQYQLRVELERRKHMLKFDAKDHHLVETFYQLKPRQTEIHSAKVIWKAIHDQQVLQYEIAMFKNWFLSTSRSTSCTFQDLQLTKINDIFSHIILDKKLSSTTSLTKHENNSIANFIEDSIQQTIITAVEIVQSYEQKVPSKQDKFQKPPSITSIINAIENHQMNMVQRAQYNITQQLKVIFQTNISDHY